LLAKPTPRNVNFGSDRFAMFNKQAGHPGNRKDEIAGKRDMTLSALVGMIDEQRQQGNLSSALRLFVLEFYRSRASKTEEDHDELRDFLPTPLPS
jgi:hypothetical protein